MMTITLVDRYDYARGKDEKCVINERRIIKSRRVKKYDIHGRLGEYTELVVKMTACTCYIACKEIFPNIGQTGEALAFRVLGAII